MQHKVRFSSKIKKHLSAMLGLILVAAAIVLLSTEAGKNMVSRLGQRMGVHGAGATVTDEYGSECIHFIDVGQGDAVLIQSGGEFCLVDTGPEDAETDLLAYLQNAGVKRLKLLVLSHPHADHVGNALAVLQRYPVDTLLLSDETLNTKEISYSLAKIKQQAGSDVRQVVAVAGQKFPVGSGELTVLFAGIEGEEFNNTSVMVRFDSETMHFLACGDAEAEEENALLQANHVPDLQADIFKASHHGSGGSNTAAFLQAVSPQVVVASCGLNNEYGHPNPQAVQRFYDAGAGQFYRTDTDGTVAVYGLGNGAYRVLTAGKAAQQAA